MTELPSQNMGQPPQDPLESSPEINPLGRLTEESKEIISERKIPIRRFFREQTQSYEFYQHPGIGRDIRKEWFKDFKLCISKHAEELIGEYGWKRFRALVEADLEDVAADPYGERSIDPRKDILTSRRLRTVNALGPVLEELAGVPVAVKGTGEITYWDQDREDLVAQYNKMRRLAISAEDLPEPWKEFIRICEVYGVISSPVESQKGADQWLFMENIKGGKWVEDFPVNRVRVGFGQRQPSRPELAFQSEDHPRLAEIAANGGIPKKGKVCWNEVVAVLRIYGLEISDLAGRNVLYRGDDPETRTYVLIDQK